MMRKRDIRIRFGPLSLSLLAAGITAVGFAAVSLADNGRGSGNSSDGNGAQTFRMPAPPGGEAGVTVMGEEISTEDRQKLEDFRKCMEDNGAPAPPDPSEIDPSEGPPEPPSAADREQLRKAFEACREKLPEKLRDAGPPGIRSFHCGPPPGDVPQQKGQNQNQGNQSGMQSSGSAA